MSKITTANMRVIHNGNDCTNGGISANTKYLTVAWGGDEAWESDADLVLCDGTNGRSIVIRDERHMTQVLADKNGYLKVTDRKGSQKGLCGPMNGGNFICGDYVPNNILRYPVAIHDRYETWELYDALSR